MGFAVASATLARPSAAAHAVGVIVPDGHNLQFLAHWLALGTGAYAQRGVTPEAVVAPHPRLAVERFTNHAAPFAILPAPLYLAAASENLPMRVIANLLAHDPINLVVSAALAAELPPPTAPLHERMAALSGKKVGVAPGPVLRLRALLEAVGLADDHLEVVELPGPKQNRAFESGHVDALYAHTPFLERALVGQGAALYVNQSAGEVPALGGLLIHALVATPTMLDEQPEVVQALVDALVTTARAARAASTFGAAAAALHAMFPERPLAELETIARLYAPALPESLRPTADAAMRTRPLYPNLQRDLLTMDHLHAVVDDRFVLEAERPPVHDPSRLAYPAAAMVAAGAAGWLLARPRRRTRNTRTG